MELRANGIDVFYVDESERHPISVTTAVRAPFLRRTEAGWSFVWEQYLNEAITWRRVLSRDHEIRFREELHAHKLLRCQGLYHRTGRNLSPEEARQVFASALNRLTFLPENSIISTYANEHPQLMGHKGVSACLLGMFQRLRIQCNREAINAMIFFDDGHDSYIRLFRQAQKYLPTGSALGGWEGGQRTRNLPLSMFPKDGNYKRSHLSYFVQIADLVAYSARLKLEYERGALPAKRIQRHHHTVYDETPRERVNLAATRRRDDGLVPV